MEIKILVLFSNENNLLESKREIEGLLFSKIKKDGAIDLIVNSSFIGEIEINPEILKDIDGILYTSDVQRKDVEKLTLLLKDKIKMEIVFAKISTEIDRFDVSVKNVFTINNIDCFPFFIESLIKKKLI